MKKIYYAVVALLFYAWCQDINAQVSVKGYYRKDGTYVRPHQRTRPNNTVTDNYSYRGNSNSSPSSSNTNNNTSTLTPTSSTSGQSYINSTNLSTPSIAPKGAWVSEAQGSNFFLQIDTTVYSLELTTRLDFIRNTPEIKEGNVLTGVPPRSVIGVYDISMRGFSLIKYNNHIGFIPTEVIYIPNSEPESKKKKKFWQRL